LPQRQAQVLALRYINELSVAEIAETLRVADGTVKALMHQGRTRLARQLAAKGWVDDEI
jgi:RNA polymerase sigma-70 factor (ECF subfamily)